ncbi:MAG: class I SAM-dependent methyltransferase [Spirochaetes bacterium]|nr:class I SAM-dependent methyltransferase [Spirochaetota bacterium]
MAENKTFINKTISKCPICSSKQQKKIFLEKWDSSSFVRCQKCNLIFQNPQENLNQTIDRYGSEYFKYELENQFNFFNLIKKTLDDFDIVKRLPKNASILEIGSATGLFLKYMDSMGFKSVGVEICKESVEYGIKEYAVNLLNKRLEDMNFDDASFDFIHFSHLIEHLNDPMSFLMLINRLLKDDGIAMITTPNSSGLFARYFMESWRCIVDDHLFIFNKNNLKQLFYKINYIILKEKTWGSIPAGKSNKIIKRFFDWFVKKIGQGDVVCFLVKKKGWGRA